ncbi:MAG TPA: glycosyltransferase family 2 protein [Hyphomicrobiales bacterium]|nr:glycosyltransferase family 2 protein [Hyphomicrobiales bacterium]
MADFAKLGRDLGLLSAGGVAVAAATWHGRALRSIQDRTRHIRDGDVLVLCVVDAATARLDPFLDHYRGLGADHFLVLATGEGSVGSRSASAKDISLWAAPAGAKRHVIHWCNALLRRFGSGHLCVTVEAEDLLLYPQMATRSLHAVGQFLRDDRRLGMAATVVDAEGTAVAAADLVRIPVVWWRRHYAYRGSTAHALPIRLERIRERGPLALTGCLFHGAGNAPAAAGLVQRGLMSPGAWF